MELYSEYHNGDRKATITHLRRSWDSTFDVWEVAMYIGNRVIQRSTLKSSYDADTLVEDFINGGGTNGPTLLNESISNG